MADLSAVLMQNKWVGATFHGSLAVNKMLQDGIVAPVRGSVRQDIDGLDSKNMKSVIVSGIIYREFAEPKAMDASNNILTAHELGQTETRIKTFYQAYAELERTIQQDIMPLSVEDARVHLTNFFGEYWTQHWNKLAAYTIRNVSKIAGITVGSTTENFSAKKILQVRKLRGDRGYETLGALYMNSTTIDDILVKQADGVIAKPLIVETHGKSQIETEGVRTYITSEKPEYKYNGVTPIVIDDDMQDGLIAIVDKGAILIGERALDIPLESVRTADSGMGSGVTKIITRKSFIFHPAGFDFTGVHGTDFASVGELSYEELENNNLYAITNNDVKRTKISCIKVKIGA